MTSTLALPANAPAPELREYQSDALRRIFEARARGIRRQLGVAATGLGKTVIFCALARKVGARTLILAHRDELVEQAMEKIAWVWPDASVGRIQGKYDETGAHVLVASVQTLARERRLSRLDPTSIGLLITDEAHHAAADSYGRIYSYLAAGDPGGPFHLGVTATADRGDRKGLDGIFDEITFQYPILWGIRSGYLSDLRGRQVRMANLDLSAVKIRGGDYNEGQLGTALEDAHAPEHVVAAWNLEAKDRRSTIVFTPTIALADETAAEFRRKGIEARSVSGVPMDERRAALAGLHDGTVRVITNCAVLTEGFDEPAVDCIVIARPTRSRALYTQMIGRATRRFPGKDDALILDIVGATDEHDLCTIPSLFGIDPEDDRPKTAAAPISEIVADQEQRLVAAGRLRAEEVELFHRLQKRKVAWIRAAGRYAVSANEETVVLERAENSVTPDRWNALVLVRGETPRVLTVASELTVAQGMAEDYIRKHAVAAFVDTSAPWRKRRPSPKQMNAARKWRIAVRPDWTAGDVADAISSKVAEVRLREQLVRRSTSS